MNITTAKMIFAVTGTAAVLTLGITGIAMASIPDSSGVIHACYQSPPPAHGANLQVIDTGAGGSCGGGMTALAWNQTGPQGATGPAGPKATAQDVTSQVTYNVPATGPTEEEPVLACPPGTLALNGGVQLEQPGTPDPGFTVSQNGSAVPQFSQDASGNGLPRPVNSGASWKLSVNVIGALEIGQGQQQQLPVTVTYFVICE